MSKLVSYTVKSGDTLNAIAAKYCTSVAEIANRNNIPNPDLIYVGQVLNISSGSPTCTNTQNTAPLSNNTDEEQAVLNLINRSRIDAGKNPLMFDFDLIKVARIKAQDLVNNNYLGHTSPIYGTFAEMLNKFQICHGYAGENIAGNGSVEGACQSWMNSNGHRKNILNQNYTHTGIGIASSPNYGKIFVQMFISK